MIAGEMASGQKEMAGARDSELEQGIDCRARWSAPNRKLRADPDDAEFGERARRPPLSSAEGDNPLPGQRMMLMRWYQEGHQHVHIEQSGHLGVEIAVQQSIDVRAGQGWRVRWHPEHGNAVANLDVGVDQALEHVFDEGIDRLAGLGGQHRDSLRQAIV